MKERNYFCAANTGDGFVNLFNNILPLNKKTFRYVIKGGSGTGKSTFMRKIAEHFKGKIESIEYFYCSSDSSSLDAIHLVNENICFVDGTSPHVVDASIPMVADKIVNVGEFIGDGVFSDADKITDIISRKKRIYANLYCYIACCKNVYEIIKNDASSKSEREKREYYLKEISACEGNCACERGLFINCVDENGLTDFVEKNKYKSVRKIRLNSYDFCIFIQQARKKLLERGNAVTVFYNVYNPSDVFAVLIEGSDELILRDCAYLGEDDDLLKELTLRAGLELKKAKTEHKKLEELYIKRMNYDGLNGLYEKTVIDVERRIKQLKSANKLKK